MLKKLCLFLLFMFFTLDAFSESVVELRSGTVLVGEIIQEDNLTLKLKTNDQVVVTIEKDKIIKISNAKLLIITKNGSRYVGEIIEENDSLIKLRTEDDLIMEIPKSQIQEKLSATTSDLNRPMPSYYTNSNQRSEWPYSYKQNSNANGGLYYMPTDYNLGHYNAGISLILPGGVNFVFGYTSNDVGFRLQGGYIGDIYGLQGNFLLNLSQTRNVEVNLGICGGFTHLREEITKTYSNSYYYEKYTTFIYPTYSYVGLTLDVNIYGFFVEAGISVGDVDNYYSAIESPQLLFAIGYVHRFNKR
jgi:hypothetical protein